MSVRQFTVASWNVEHFRGGPERVERVEGIEGYSDHAMVGFEVWGA